MTRLALSRRGAQVVVDDYHHRELNRDPRGASHGTILGLPRAGFAVKFEQNAKGPIGSDPSTSI